MSFPLIAAIAGAAVLAASGPGTRMGLWPYGAGLAMVLLAGVVGLVALSTAGRTLAAAGGPEGAPWGAAVAALVALAVLALPAAWVARAVTAPVVNDVTTDGDDPPPLDRAAPPATDASLAPLVLDIAAARVLALAAETAVALGWAVDSRDPDPGVDAGLLRATETTAWFGFVDDVAIRVRSLDDGRARVDLRSASRVGTSDLGTNARRIRGFLRALAAAARGATEAGA